MPILPALRRAASGTSFSFARLRNVLGDGLRFVRRAFHPVVLACLIHAPQFGWLGFHDGGFRGVFLKQNEGEAETGNCN